ncbi:glycosyltransferase family 4 protein, partial [bacterium]|nr:glycosyltransferase family 4 protein [bacterium]
LTWIEAMASGLPVMTTNVEGANEIVIDGETGYVSSNVDVLSRKLLYVLENEKLLSHMSSEAQKFVFENYNLEKAVDRYYVFWKKHYDN